MGNGNGYEHLEKDETKLTPMFWPDNQGTQ